MNIREICRRGYFDKVTLNISIEPIISSDTEIYSDMSFLECISNESNQVDNTISKVRLSILGVDFIKRNCIRPDELSKDKKRGANVFKVEHNDIKSFLIAYSDIFIVKDSSNICITKDRPSNYNYDVDMLIDKAIEIQKKSNGRNHIAIVDKLFVNEQYRRCGISSWVHINLRDIIMTYMDINIGDVLLIPGDFSNEAERLSIPEKAYTDMLKKHYSELGYRMCRAGYMRSSKQIKTDTNGRKFPALLNIIMRNK